MGYWGEDTEGYTGTIKQRGGKDVSAEAESSSMEPMTTEEAKTCPYAVPQHSCDAKHYQGTHQ